MSSFLYEPCQTAPVPRHVSQSRSNCTCPHPDPKIGQTAPVPRHVSKSRSNCTRPMSCILKEVKILLHVINLSVMTTVPPGTFILQVHVSVN